mmetsp:Transcript_25531/g.30985  ORF Transcript_25531/g.30985 Transcript_25531/m.30985 type:complete len:1362 (+) Transcript_25531:1568-5653(+)
MLLYTAAPYLGVYDFQRIVRARQHRGGFARACAAQAHTQSYTGTMSFLIDNACYPYHVCNNIDWFHEIDHSRNTALDAVSSTQTTSSGIGSIEFTVWNELTHTPDTILLTDVVYLPDQPHNLISHTRLTEIGLIPDYSSLTVRGTGCEYSISRSGGVFPWHGISHTATAYASTGPTRSDWRWLTSECTHYGSRYGNMNGVFDFELFRADGNHLLADGSTDSFSLQWTGKSFYGNPVYENDFIYQTLSKALNDFDLDPDNTKFFFVLPYWPEASWYHLTTQFEEVYRYPEGSKIFSCPGALTYDPASLEAAPPSEGEGRYFIAGTPWPVCLFHKDKHTVTTVDDDWLAHFRLGHPGARVIQSLLDRGLDIGLQPHGRCDELHCSICRKAKMTRPPVPADSHIQSEIPFSLVFSDVHGPVNPTSKEGYRYSVMFVDACTGYPKQYFMRSLTEVADALLDFIAWVRSIGHRVESMVLRTDNAKYYVHGRFSDICKSDGIYMQTTAPYVHTNNSVVERLWRTILAIARSLLISSGLDHTYWPLAWSHAVYLYSIRGHSGKGMISPHELLFHTVPDYASLRVFGCRAHAFIDPTLRHKLDDVAAEGLYVGREENSNCHLILQPETGRLIRSGWVKFDEDPAHLGKVVSTPTASLSDMLFVSEMSRKPPPDLQTSISVEEVTHISSHSTYYHTEDAETYAILRVHTAQQTEGFWVHARDFLQPPSPPAHFEMLRRYFQSSQQMAVGNPHFPIFSPVTVSLNNRKNAATRGAFIVSTDEAHNKPYGVCYDNRDGSIEELHFQDVSRNRVTFPAVALAAALNTVSSQYTEPTSYLHSQTYPDAPLWLEATMEEVNSFIKLKVILPLDESDIPRGANIVNTKFIYKLKRTSDGGIERYKARLVAQGFTQQYGVDYTDTFAPVSQVLSVRLVLILSVQYGLSVHHVDVKCAFLNATLKEEVYIRLPKGFEIGGKSYGRALKSIYGLKQAAHDWSELQHGFIMSYDTRMRQSSVEPCLYYIITDELMVLINTHVDDYTICVSDHHWYITYMVAFGTRFEVNDLGQVEHLLQTRVTWGADDTEVSLSQVRHIDDLAKSHGVQGCKPVNSPMEHGLHLDPETDTVTHSHLPYRSLIGSLWWIARVSRPDVMYAVMYLSRFSNAYGSIHYKHLLRVLKYLITTREYTLDFRKHCPETAPLRVCCYSDAERFPDEPMLTGASLESYSDSDWAGDKTDRRSVSGSIVYLFGNPVTWSSHRQTTVALSSAEAEYYAMADATKETLHVKQLISELFPSLITSAVPIHVDNKGAGYIAENMINNKRTKHIDIRYHFIRHYIRDKTVELFHVPTHLNVSDIMTKALPVQTFRKLTRMLLSR